MTSSISMDTRPTPKASPQIGPVSNLGQKKIIDKIRLASKKNVPLYSFEYFPPKTDPGISNLRDRICRMGLFDPLFIDITNSKTSNTLELAEDLLQHTAVDIMVHLSMTDMSKNEIRQYLDKCKSLGIRNILAVRGDPSPGCDTWEPVESDFEHACDLVSLIRKEYGNYFHISVGGYPEGHCNAIDLDKDISYLKEKINCGADCITTQLFYDTKLFFKFVEKCRNNDINVPIIPGLMPIQTYSTFVRIVSFANVTVPSTVWKDLEPIKDNDEKVKEYGIKYCTQMCQEILNHKFPKININSSKNSSKNSSQNSQNIENSETTQISQNCKALHFYTFNLERSVTKVLERLNLLYNNNDTNNNNDTTNNESNNNSNLNENIPNTNLPWQSAIGIQRRCEETVRPIFWSNRNESYIRRTQHWDEFPNGRWGDNRSPAYGEFPNHYLLGHGQKLQNISYRHSQWSNNNNNLLSFNDIYNVFVKYLNGDINILPWCMDEIRPETLTYLLPSLKILNKYGFLTINSQPQINAAPSNDQIVGWGRSNGYVYQKAYLEFFISKKKLNILLNIINQSKKYNSLTYQAVNKLNDLKINCGLNDVNAVTWGVFPSCEILQPTIVDTQSFIAWKDEAFSLWSTYWQSIYPKKSKANELIGTICKEWYLVNIVENDFIFGDIFAPFREYFEQTIIDKNELNQILKTLNETHKEQQNLMYRRSLSRINNNNCDNNSNEYKDNNYTNTNTNVKNDIDDSNNPYLDKSFLININNLSINNESSTNHDSNQNQTQIISNGTTKHITSVMKTCDDVESKKVSDS